MPLKVAAGKLEIGKANDIWSESDLPLNVGEYDFQINNYTSGKQSTFAVEFARKKSK